MAKKKATTEAVAKPNTPLISLEKYFQLENPPIHIYTRAALEVEFHGIIKSVKEWASEMEGYRGA